jgi:hypothetical protein
MSTISGSYFCGEEAAGTADCRRDMAEKYDLETPAGGGKGRFADALQRAHQDTVGRSCEDRRAGVHRVRARRAAVIVTRSEGFREKSWKWRKARLQR